MKIKFFAYFTLFIVVLFTVSPTASMDLSPSVKVTTEKNSLKDSSGSGTPVCPGGISYGETIECSIVSNETDTYTFTGNINDKVVIRVQIASGHFDPSLHLDAPGGICKDSTIFNLLELNCTLTSGGTHTISVSGSTGQTGGYNLFLQKSNDPADQTAIAYGQTLSHNVTIAPEMKVFAFSGSSGDHVILRMQITSGSFDPNLRIYNPNGSLLCSDDTIFDLLELNCILTTDGLHTIFAYGDSNQTGGYNLFLQKSNDPTNQMGIAYGQTLSDNVTIAPEMKVFAFSGSSGDRVILRMQITSGSFDPNLRIYNPNGSLLCSDDTIFDLLELNCILTTDGPHTIFAYGDSNQTGGYNLFLQKSNNPTNQTAIAYGQTLSDHVTIAPEMKVFAFSGSSGDRVILRMQITSGSFDPNLRIYNPNGSLLCSDDTIFDLLELNCILTTDGLHTIFAYGDSNQTGGYNLFLQKSNDPTNQMGIAYGQTLSDNVTIAPEMKVFAFSGSSGDRVILRMQITSGSFDPNLRIYNPNGSLLCSDDTIFDLLELNCILTTDGLHTIFAYGDSNQTGGYNLFLQKSNDPTNQMGIAYGQTLSDNVTIAPEMKVFAFSGNSGDHVILRMQITSGSFDPNLRIYNPNGSLLCSDDTIFDLLELNCTLTTDGLHTIFAYGDSNQTGSYKLCVRDNSTTCDYKTFLPFIIK